MNTAVILFPLWVSTAAILALIHPPLFTWFSGYLITIGLGIIMLGMGLTLTVRDFQRAAGMPLPVLTAAILQFTVMPVTGWLLGYIFNLPDLLALGLVLVAACPGGTASNVITFIAKADVPLSVTMTAVSTLLSVLMTPALTYMLAAHRVEVSAAGLLFSTLQVVILPVALGLLLRRYFIKLSRLILPAAPLTAVIMITLIVASIIGSNRGIITGSAIHLFAAVILLHLTGFILGYLLTHVIFREKTIARTISIEVGMQNSGLGVVLAENNFTNPAAAVPSAISSLTHSVIGSIAAALFRKNTENDKHQQRIE